MCSAPKPKIEKADPVAPPPPAIAKPAAPVLNESTQRTNADSGAAAKARKGRSSLTIARNTKPTTGVNIPR